MLLQKNVLSVALLLLLSVCGYAQKQALSKINQEDLKEYLNFIASDNLQGRAFNTEVNGLEITANYLAKVADKLGLKPGYENYFQTVDLIFSEPDNDNTYLHILNRNKKISYSTSRIMGMIRGADVEEFEGQVVYAGFGWKDEKSEYNDFEGMDINGKVVLFSAGKPDSFMDDEPFRFDFRMEISKMENAIKAGAKGVILVNNPLDENNITFNRYTRRLNGAGYNFPKQEQKEENQNFVFATSDFADEILGGKGRFQKLLRKTSKKKKPNSFLIKNITVNARIRKKCSKVTGKNVIGYVEGSHPKLKNECVVLMAHYDHLGMNKNGDVYNGADDNGSGTVTLLEVAEAFMSLENKPKRSIVFLWVTAEEVGLLGSGYYTENPLFPLDKTMACINIDMDGRVYEPRDSIWNRSSKLVKDFDGLYTLSNNVWPELKTINNQVCEDLQLVPDNTLPASFLRSSDHYHFHKKGVPILNFATGYHADYHKVGDEISKINFDKMKRVADLCFLVGLEIANKKQIILK